MQPQRAGEATRRSQEPQSSGRDWMLRNPKRNGGNGFLRETCQTYLLSAVHHILRTRAAVWPQPRFQPTEAKSSISTILHWLAAVASTRQPRSQWISCNPKLGYHNSIFSKDDATLTSCCRSQGPQASGRERRLRFHKRPGFLRQTCRINLFSAVRHI